MSLKSETDEIYDDLKKESFGVYFYKQKDGGYSVRITGNVYK